MPSRSTRVSRHPRKGTRGVRAHDRDVNIPRVPHRDIKITKTQQTRLRRLKKRLSKATARDESIADDIVTVAINDRNFYKTRVQGYIGFLVRKKKKGQLKKDMALLGWTNQVKSAIKSYNKAMKEENRSFQPKMYSPEVKAKIAESFNDHYYPDIKRGNYD